MIEREERCSYIYIYILDYLSKIRAIHGAPSLWQGIMVWAAHTAQGGIRAEKGRATAGTTRSKAKLLTYNLLGK